MNSKIKILLSLACCLWVSVSGTPRLTVVIAVDGLRADNMEYMRNYWLPGGLRTLQEESAATQVTFDFNVQGDEETLATVLTGVEPSEHGLSLNRYFSRTDGKVHSFFEDENEQGIGTREQVSLRRMVVPTLSDMYRLRYDKYTKVYSVGLQKESALLLAGHSADGCCWLDANTNKWATSTYYNGLPSAADAENMSDRKTDSYEGVKRNSLVADLALRLQEEQQLGMDDTPDLLMLQMSVRKQESKSDCIQGNEDEDTHQAVNLYMGFLIEQLQKRVGKGNVRFVVMGVPRYGQSGERMKQAGIDVREFNLGRATALTSVYLMAIYGYEQWLSGSYGQSVYLNKTLIEDKGQDLHKIERQVADFLTDFEGVRAAYPRHEALLAGEVTRGLAKAYTGDVVVCLQPQWRMMADEETAVDKVIENKVDAPLYILGGGDIRLPASIRATDVIHWLQ